MQNPQSLQDKDPLLINSEEVSRTNYNDAYTTTADRGPHTESSGIPMNHLSFIGRWRYRRALRKQAKIDYRSARGTIHKLQIQGCLKNLKSELNQLRKREARELQELNRLDKRRQEALRNELNDHLIQDRLIEADGIGRQTADRIRRMVYRNKLADLHMTRQRLKGVGLAKQASISRWVRKMEQELPALLESEFPGKNGVLASYRSEERLVQISLRIVRKDIAALNDLILIVENALESLAWVSERTFYDRLVGVEHRSLENYSLGVFPPWGRPPAWFVQLLNEFGG